MGVCIIKHQTGGYGGWLNRGGIETPIMTAMMMMMMIIIMKIQQGKKIFKKKDFFKGAR